MNLGLTILKGRRSIRKYKEEEISEEIIQNALDAARLGPTARNQQPWVIGVVKDKETLLQLSEIATYGKFIKDANACFAVFAERDHKFFVEDGSAATMQIILALWAYGVGSCWIAGDKMDYAEEARVLLNVPEKYTLISLIPAGYPAEVTIPSKKELKEISFREKFEAE
ncbi:nitroreductase family protein [Methanoplanus sp. FWC-SCC4]|uniref:Nitroreductase family protein n=1 Tax=Methanochimaera problematica TaxID=2609417 RepID=A0AA97I4J4_9EURY|nr:nitroreductase family protein [Methanoplanus sp. FWC-SCC4]WOF16574.1 nitroreductase family protein [Methanoplanus sp. FWC-SCC4]